MYPTMFVFAEISLRRPFVPVQRINHLLLSLS